MINFVCVCLFPCSSSLTKGDRNTRDSLTRTLIYLGSVLQQWPETDPPRDKTLNQMVNNGTSKKCLDIEQFILFES